MRILSADACKPAMVHGFLRTLFGCVNVQYSIFFSVVATFGGLLLQLAERPFSFFLGAQGAGRKPPLLGITIPEIDRTDLTDTRALLLPAVARNARVCSGRSRRTQGRRRADRRKCGFRRRNLVGQGKEYCRNPLVGPMQVGGWMGRYATFSYCFWCLPPWIVFQHPKPILRGCGSALEHCNCFVSPWSFGHPANFVPLLLSFFYAVRVYPPVRSPAFFCVLPVAVARASGQ